MSEADINRMAREGVPKDILDDPEAMQLFQIRMNGIAQMTNLMSNLQRMLHDMNKQCIQNIRA